MAAGPEREFGMGKGKVFPEAQARSLLNPFRRLLQSPARTVAAMGLDPHHRVLEAGAGPGFFSPSLARALPAGELVVLDLQPAMVRLARDRLADMGNVATVQGDAVALPFPEATFDAVLLATMLGEVPDRGACIADARRVLRRGGSLSVAETRRDSDFIAWPELKRLVEPHGFVAAGRHGIAWQYVGRFRAV